MANAYATDSSNKPLTFKATKTASDSALWQIEESNELLRLLEKTGTMMWMDPASKPSDRVASYYNPQVKVKIKDGVLQRRVRGTYGGNITDYTGDRSALTADMQTFKLLCNAVVSEGADFMTADISDYYLGSDLERDEFMWLTRAQVPADICARYGDRIIWHDQRTMVRIVKGLFGLPQAGRLAADKLTTLLLKHGYYKAPHTACLFRHHTLDIAFCLVVDDFAIKYKGRAAAEHLLSTVRQEYEIKPDWDGTHYIGMTLAHDKLKHTLTLSMPGYVPAALKRFNVHLKGKPTHSPSLFVPVTYGRKEQLATVDDSPPLSARDAKFIQEVIGVFLYYSRAVDCTMFTCLNKLASRQAKPTQNLYDAVQHFLQYAASYPSAELTYFPSNMQLIVWSDASYLSESCARSRAGGLHYCSTISDDPSKAPVNGAVDVLSAIIPTVVSAASEAELAALFLNGQSAVATRNTLADLGYPQPPTPLITDNSTASGIANNTIRLKRSKSMDMRYHWVRDRVQHGDFTVTWGPGGDNLADYFTKIHPPQHFRSMRSTFVADSCTSASHCHAYVA